MKIIDSPKVSKLTKYNIVTDEIPNEIDCKNYPEIQEDWCGYT